MSQTYWAETLVLYAKVPGILRMTEAKSDLKIHNRYRKKPLHKIQQVEFIASEQESSNIDGGEFAYSIAMQQSQRTIHPYCVHIYLVNFQIRWETTAFVTSQRQDSNHSRSYMK